MFGTVFRSFLFALVVITALVKVEETIEFSPYANRCKVQAQLTVLVPRSSPCQRHKRFNGSRLYLTLLLLLLAGDIEMNPGPAQIEMENIGTVDDSETREPKRDVESSCTVCGMQLASLELRSRVVTNTQIKCSVATCNSSIHFGCRNEKRELSAGWTCPRHSNTQDHEACVSDPPVEISLSPPETASNSDTVMQLASSEHHTDEEKTNECPHPQRHTSAAKAVTLEDIANGIQEPIPGPSYVSASLMDLMEALRLTQLKIEKLADDIHQMKQMLNGVLGREAAKSMSHLHHSRGSSDRQQRSNPNILQPTADTTRRPQPAAAHVNRQVSNGKYGAERQQGSDQSILVIGDSNVRRLQAGHRDSNVTFHSVAGAVTENITQELNQSVENSNATDVVFHIGTNDVVGMGSEVVAKNIFGLAEQARGLPGVRRVYICSVTSRKDRGSFIFSRTESVNSRLHSMCLRSNDVSFIDLRHQLDHCPFNGMSRDGLHYNRAGTVQVLRSIGDRVGNFLV